MSFNFLLFAISFGYGGSTQLWWLIVAMWQQKWWRRWRMLICQQHQEKWNLIANNHHIGHKNSMLFNREKKKWLTGFTKAIYSWHAGLHWNGGGKHLLQALTMTNCLQAADLGCLNSPCCCYYCSEEQLLATLLGVTFMWFNYTWAPKWTKSIESASGYLWLIHI